LIVLMEMFGQKEVIPLLQLSKKLNRQYKKN
jgi:hypothetical protein